MSLTSLKEKLASKNFSVAFGEVVRINATVIIARGLAVSIGDMVKVVSRSEPLHETKRGDIELSPYKLGNHADTLFGALTRDNTHHIANADFEAGSDNDGSVDLGDLTKGDREFFAVELFGDG